MTTMSSSGRVGRGVALTRAVTQVVCPSSGWKQRLRVISPHCNGAGAAIGQVERKLSTLCWAEGGEPRSPAGGAR